MNKKTLKTVIIVLILFLAGVAGVLGVKTVKNYLGGAQADEIPQNVQAQAEDTTVAVTWQTSKEVLSTIEYGTNQSNLLLRAPESQPSTIHRVSLAPLKPNTVYYFRIRVGDTLYDNNGIAFSFKTKAGSAEETSVATPTPAAGLVTSCNQADFESQMGSQNPAYDFDKNGIVNTKDWLECLQTNR